MTNKIYKRIYRVAFHPEVIKMIEGAKNGECVCWGYHDLIDHYHEDTRFQQIDLALKDSFDELCHYYGEYQRQVTKNMNKLAKKQGWTSHDLKRIEKELDKDSREMEEERQYKNQRIFEMLDTGQINDQAYFEMMRNVQKEMMDRYSKSEREAKQKLKKQGKLTYEQIRDKAVDIAHEICGDGPSGYQGLDSKGNAPIWKPVFDRGYWEFEHISKDIPDWISEREYSIAHEEVYEPEVKKLKTKKGTKVNWSSRNRGNKVVVSSKKFRKDTKEYPPHLDNGV